MGSRNETVPKWTTEAGTHWVNERAVFKGGKKFVLQDLPGEPEIMFNKRSLNCYQYEATELEKNTSFLETVKLKKCRFTTYEKNKIDSVMDICENILYLCPEDEDGYKNFFCSH